MNPRKDYKAAFDLRMSGRTYGEIRNIFGIPKSTLSTWFSKLKLDSKVKKVLESKRKSGYLKLVEFNKVRTLNIGIENENARKDYELKIGKLNKRELMILGAALYWGEGYKNFDHTKKRYPYISFSNSDPLMVKVFIKFLEDVLGIPREKLNASAMIYPNMDSTVCIKYWQEITAIPKEKFKVYKALSRASSMKRPSNLLPYGTLQIRINNRLNFFKVMGLIDGVTKNT